MSGFNKQLKLEYYFVFRKIRLIKKIKNPEIFRVLGLDVKIFWVLGVGVKPTLHPKPTCFWDSTVWLLNYFRGC
jgi:hypothetical protein